MTKPVIFHKPKCEPRCKLYNDFMVEVSTWSSLYKLQE